VPRNVLVVHSLFKPQCEGCVITGLARAQYTSAAVDPSDFAKFGATSARAKQASMLLRLLGERRRPND